MTTNNSDLNNQRGWPDTNLTASSCCSGAFSGQIPVVSFSSMSDPSRLQPAMIPMRPLDIVAGLREQIREEVRQELISEKANESSLKEFTPERMKRKLDSILSKEKTDE